MLSSYGIRLHVTSADLAFERRCRVTEPTVYKFMSGLPTLKKITVDGATMRSWAEHLTSIPPLQVVNEVYVSDYSEGGMDKEGRNRTFRALLTVCPNMEILGTDYDEWERFGTPLCELPNADFSRISKLDCIGCSGKRNMSLESCLSTAGTRFPNLRIIGTIEFPRDGYDYFENISHSAPNITTLNVEVISWLVDEDYWQSYVTKICAAVAQGLPGLEEVCFDVQHDEEDEEDLCQVWRDFATSIPAKRLCFLLNLRDRQSDPSGAWPSALARIRRDVQSKEIEFHVGQANGIWNGTLGAGAQVAVRMAMRVAENKSQLGVEAEVNEGL